MLSSYQVNIFRPYEVVESTPHSLHLRESAFRRGVLFFVFRLLPLTFIVLLLIILRDPDFPPAFQVLTALLATVATVLFFSKSYVTDVQMDRRGFDIKVHRFMQVGVESFAMADVEKITVKLVQGRGGGQFFRLRLKTGRSVPLFAIPVMQMRTDRLPLIIEQLQAVTGLPVERTGAAARTISTNS